MNYINCNHIELNNPSDFNDIDAIILPGVGAFDAAMQVLNNSGMAKSLIKANLNKTPIFGICLGMQLLATESIENGLNQGLSILPMKIKKIDNVDNSIRVPHMGWNQVAQTVHHPLWKGIPNKTRFYFVHSYWVKTEDRLRVMGEVDYGVEFDAAIAKENLFAVQFHPEKSHEMGLRLLKNFLIWEGLTYISSGPGR